MEADEHGADPASQTEIGVVSASAWEGPGPSAQLVLASVILLVLALAGMVWRGWPAAPPLPAYDLVMIGDDSCLVDRTGSLGWVR